MTDVKVKFKPDSKGNIPSTHYFEDETAESIAEIVHTYTKWKNSYVKTIKVGRKIIWTNGDFVNLFEQIKYSSK